MGIAGGVALEAGDDALGAVLAFTLSLRCAINWTICPFVFLPLGCILIADRCPTRVRWLDKIRNASRLPRPQGLDNLPGDVVNPASQEASHGAGDGQVMLWHYHQQRRGLGALRRSQSCATQEEIAEAVDVTHQTVANWETDFAKNSDDEDFANSRDFDPPIYNVWKQQNKSNSVSHFGNSEPRWVENLLYLYTSPAGIVVDPFAGSGSTIDVCKKHGRRYYVSDRKPIVEREHEIRIHDLIGSDGSIQMPNIPRWKDVDLVYLDPPYWLQASGQYSNDPTDFGNMPIDQFNASLSGIITAFARKLKNGKPRFIALIIQPTQWKADNRQFTDHVGDMLRAVKLPVHMRYSVPYESQQCTAQMVDWAKDNKRCLVLTREIIVWEVA